MKCKKIALKRGENYFIQVHTSLCKPISFVWTKETGFRSQRKTAGGFRFPPDPLKRPKGSRPLDTLVGHTTDRPFVKMLKFAEGVVCCPLSFQ